MKCPKITFPRHEVPLTLWSRYREALCIGAGAIVARWFLDPLLDSAGFALFLAAVLTMAWRCGIGPVWIVQTLLLFAQMWLFTSLDQQTGPMTVRGMLGVGAYYLVGTVVAAISEARRASLLHLAAQSALLLRREAELSATISAMGDGLLVVDGTGLVRILNPRAESLSGWHLDEVRGWPVDVVLCLRDEAGLKPVASQIERVMRYGDSIHDSRVLQLINRAGQQIPVTYNLTPVRSGDGEVTGAVLVLRDERERCRAEEQLREMNHRKDEFLATLAHELRNPLSPIRTGIELVKLSQGDEKVVHQVMDIMDRQVRHVVRLVDDLLDVSRISRGKLHLRKSPTRLSRVVSDAIETMRPQIEGAQHKLTVSLPDDHDLVEGDYDRLTQIACNLLHNAIKFTPAGGRIEVKVERTEAEVRLDVSDNGAGIPPDKMESIFELFNQGSAEKEHGKAGLGVGLTLARRLAEMHGGSVEAYSPGINKGSTFRLRLPLAVEPSSAARPLQLPEFTNPATGRRVLVVDDNEDALRTTAMMLQALGHETCTATNGMSGLDMAASFRPEIVFMDLGMPGLNGYEAAEKIRRSPWGRDITLIALTGWGQDRDRQRTLAAGFDGHLVKPIDTEALHGCLTKLRSQMTSSSHIGEMS